jgi:hypothetical protein
MSLNGEEVDDIINQNGGSGDFEIDDDGAKVERWVFPRFLGAESLGTCTVKSHEGNHQKTDGCKKFKVDKGNLYLSRTGIGPNDTDVETLVSWLQAPRNLVGFILLLSLPGTGKTALIESAATHLAYVTGEPREMMTVLCTPDHTKDSLLLRFVGEGHGDLLPNGERSPFTLGPLAYAAKHGLIFYADEFMLLDDGVKPIFYSLADGRHYLPEGNVDGSPLEIHENFRLVISSNPLVRGASLPEPMASRAASTTLTIETNGAMLRDLNIDEAIVSAWEALGVQGLWRPQIREMRMADYWLEIDVNQAISAFLPEHCPESQRSDVRACVEQFLGGNIRPDGRLVVS